MRGHAPLHETREEDLLSFPKPPVDKAVKLLYASLLLGIVKVVADFSHLSSLGSAGFVLFVGAFTAAVCYFFLIGQVSKGRNWARITYLVLLRDWYSAFNQDNLYRLWRTLLSRTGGCTGQGDA